MAGAAVKLVLDFGVRAPFLDDLAGNAALCGDERGRGVLLGGCRLGGRRLLPGSAQLS